MNDKQMFEVRREAYKSIATVLYFALTEAENRANSIYCECSCGATEHIGEAKYCGHCGEKLNRAAENDSIEKVIAALKTLGVKGKVSVRKSSFMQYEVFVNGERFGIFNITRNTFVD